MEDVIGRLISPAIEMFPKPASQHESVKDLKKNVEHARCYPKEINELLVLIL